MNAMRMHPRQTEGGGGGGGGGGLSTGSGGSGSNNAVVGGGRDQTRIHFMYDGDDVGIRFEYSKVRTPLTTASHRLHVSSDH